MKTIFEIDKWDDPELIGKWFKSRLDWDNPETPQYSGTGKSLSVNWAEGLNHDFAKYRDSELDAETWRKYMFLGDGLEIKTLMLDCGIYSSMLVGNFMIGTGRLTIDMELSCNPEVCEAVWFLSQARYEKGGETILPEYDIMETNTPGHIGELSESKIVSYDPFRAINVDKTSADFIKNKRVRLIVYLGQTKITSEYWVGEESRTGNIMHRKYGVPVYPIIWNIAPNHLNGADAVTKIYKIKFEC